MHFPERTSSARLLLRAPTMDDAGAIFDRYTGNAEVTRWVDWPTHETLDDARAFVEATLEQRSAETSFVYLIERAGQIIGSVSLAFDAPHRAMLNFVLAKPAWRQGFACEATQAVCDLAFAQPECVRLYAYAPSKQVRAERVLHKCGFAREGFLRRHSVLPNLGDAAPQDVIVCARVRGFGPSVRG